MPWTFAHPAAVLPLRRFCGRGLSGAGLVIGSLSPDFGYYLGGFGLATWAHTAWGVLLLCLPSAWLVHALWRRVWRPLAAILPGRHREAWLARPPRRPHALAFSASAVLGASTHALWDAFTHRSGWFVQHWPALSQPLALDLPAWQWLQHASTLAGTVALAIVYRSWLSAPREAADARRYVHLLAVAALGVLAAWVLVGAPWRAPFHFALVATDLVLLGALALAGREALRQR